MIYSEFINKTGSYLRSVRILKNYVTFDMIFPSTWSTLKKAPEGLEILIESSFIKNEKVEVKVSLDEGTFSNLLQHLMINQNEKKCVIQISNLEFTFLRK
jgi:hypothetical protein